MDEHMIGLALGSPRETPRRLAKRAMSVGLASLLAGCLLVTRPTPSHAQTGASDTVNFEYTGSAEELSKSVKKPGGFIRIDIRWTAEGHIDKGATNGILQLAGWDGSIEVHADDPPYSLANCTGRLSAVSDRLPVLIIANEDEPMLGDPFPPFDTFSIKFPIPTSMDVVSVSDNPNSPYCSTGSPQLHLNGAFSPGRDPRLVSQNTIDEYESAIAPSVRYVFREKTDDFNYEFSGTVYDGGVGQPLGAPQSAIDKYIKSTVHVAPEAPPNPDSIFNQ